jgi:enoyl-CoA hydratase
VSVLRFDVGNEIAIITMNRPEARNALNPELAVRLIDALNRVRDDSTIRVAILTATGDRAFSSGGDLEETIPLMTGARPPSSHWDRRWLDERSGGGPFKTDAGKPLIAAVNGDAVAGGMELVQNCDIRIAVPAARFGIPESKVGLFPGGASTVRLPRQMPYALAMEYLLTGDLMSAEIAHRHGFLNHVVAPQDLMERAFAVAQRIAANGPLAVQAIRASARACQGLPEAEALALESRFAEPILHTQDAQEGPRAFLEKRTPRFRGV